MDSDWPFYFSRAVSGSVEKSTRYGRENLMLTNEKYAGAEWVKAAFKCEMSPLGELVADLLGDMYFGIYHLDSKSLKRTDWSDRHSIVYNHQHSMATYDGNELTRLVVLSHDRMLRVQIKGLAPGLMQIVFHKRNLREGGSMWERMPTMETAVANIRLCYRKTE